MAFDKMIQKCLERFHIKLVESFDNKRHVLQNVYVLTVRNYSKESKTSICLFQLVFSMKNFIHACLRHAYANFRHEYASVKLQHAFFKHAPAYLTLTIILNYTYCLSLFALTTIFFSLIYQGTNLT